MKITNAAVVLSFMAANGAMAATQPDTMPYEAKWSIETGIGYDTNAYHAPDHDYADYYADPTGATIVSPKEQDGMFIPFKFDVELSTPLAKHIDLVGDYSFKGDFYLDSALQDANATRHKLSVGSAFELGKKGKDGKAYAGAFVHSQDKVYVDRDSGDPKLSGANIDVSNRYTYTSYGIEGDYERKVAKDDNVGVKAAYENLDYSDPVAWSQYDHIYTMYGAYWEHYFPTDTKLTLEVTNEVRDYSDRHAYNLDGTLFASNPLLTYTYAIYAIGVRQKFSDNTKAYFDYELEQRSDSHVGYNDVDRTMFKVRVIHDLNKKIRLRGKVAYYNYDYANAYNFEDPTQGKKKRSATDFQFTGEYQWNKNKVYYVELERNVRDNTDDRYQYNDTILMLGAKWDY